MKDELIAMSEVRARMVRKAAALLVGPLGGDEELESAPADTYLTGILWPKGAAVDGADDDGGSESASDEGGGEAGVPGYRSLRPCSIGITFAVRAGAEVVVDLGTTARYVAVEAQESAESKPKRLWRRRQLEYTVTIPAAKAKIVTKLQKFRTPDGRQIEDTRLAVHVRRRPGASLDIITATLINEEIDAVEGGPRDAKSLFQTELIVRSGSPLDPMIERRPPPPADPHDRDAQINALLYRDVREFAVGHGVATLWTDNNDSSVHEVRTSWLPCASVAGTSTEGHFLLEDFSKLWPQALHADWLAVESRRTEVTDALDSFVSTYAEWIEGTLTTRVDEFEGDLASAAKYNLANCEAACERMKAGVSKLRSDENAWTAFALANAAMDRQSRFASKDHPRPLVWRPFQLAFVLLVIPGLVDPAREDRMCMDLLWFPTGGGKTEAYLALTAFQIFHRRLVDAERRADGGVDVLMRYTLRLLTVQQFQRAAALIVACDFIRESDARLGSARISLGLYVGGDATPNSMEAARKALEDEYANLKPKSTPRQLLRCPVCGSDLRASAYRAHQTQPVLDIVCEKPGCETAGRPLPVQTVDEAIYAGPSSLLIGTVDKFAQIPRRTDIRRLFALDGGSPPGLIIQDELHLISGPLGSMAGLYETVIDALCTRGNVRAKVIGSTATIGHAESQVRSLFDRNVLQFPPPGFEAHDSFYAVRDSDGPDRLYLGLSTAGRSPKFALQAVIATLLQSGSSLLDQEKEDSAHVDPYWTCVSYFNSLRELGGAWVLMQDDVPRQIQFLAGRLGTTPRALQADPVELSSRRSSRELPELLQQISGTLHDFKKDPFENPQPRDSVLASNMISVGVDVPRLGLMVVNGQPKSTAEYIQASSRVGRGLPGLVITLYNFGRPRDLSHLEHFRAYHGALYRNVEATSVTPWAPRARDKALHAVITSLVRHLVAGMQGDDAAAIFDAKDPAVQDILEMIMKRVAAACDLEEADETRQQLLALLAKWASRSREAAISGTKLRYWRKKAPFGKSLPHLMCSAEDAAPGGNLAWATPNTMRDVEPSAAFVLKIIAPRAGK